MLRLVLAGTILASACAPAGSPPSAARTGPPSAAASATARATASATPAARTTTPTEVTVQAGDHFYDPAVLTVPVGTTVVWRLVGTQVHDVVASDGSFQSTGLGPGSVFRHTFTKPGRYTYFCVPHFGDGMKGEVVVE